MDIYWIRHAQSYASLPGNKISDPGLTDKGILQAELTALWLRQKGRMDAVYTSDLLRCEATAASIGHVMGAPV